ncbi:MAG TPA: hypothetical protein VGB77_19735 [Abditibacteriaceae bacterium]|jgi:hypothetical protein
MSQQQHAGNENQTGGQNDTQNNAQNQTPLELVREQQAMEQESREVTEQRPDPSPEVPGQSSPSNIRKHPQRRLG